MYSLAEIKEQYLKTKEEKNAYEKKNYSGIAVRDVVFCVIF